MCLLIHMQNFIHILLWWNINTIYNSYQFITQVVVGRVSNVTGLEANLNLMHIFGWIISSDDDIFHMCFGRSLLTESLLTDYWCTPSARTMEHSWEVFYIAHAYFSRIQFGVNWHIFMNVEYVPWYIIFRMTVHWRYFWHVSPCIITLYDTIVQM